MPSRLRWLWLALMTPPFVLALPPLERRAHAIHGNDGFLNYAYARSLLVSGDLDFADDYAAFDALGRGYPYRLSDTPRDAVTGRPVNRYGWGSALLWAPLLFPAHLLAPLLFPEEPPGLTPLHFLAVRVGSALWGLLGLMLLVDFAARRRLLPPVHSREREPGGEAITLLGAAVTLLAATNLLFYFYLHPSMSTAPAFGLAGLGVWQLDRLETRGGAWRWAAMGAVLGLLVCTRHGDLGFVLGLLPAVAAVAWSRRTEAVPVPSAASLALLALGAALPLAVQAAVWWRIHGSPLSGPAPYLGPEYQWRWPGRFGLAVLFSPHHGWISWHPVVLVGLAGLAVLARDRARPVWLRLVPLAVVGQWLLVSAWPEWTGGASFGGRLMSTALAVVFLGLVLALDAMARRWGRWPTAALASLLILWNLGLMAQYGLGMIDRQAPVSPLTMAANQWRLLLRLFGGG